MAPRTNRRLSTASSADSLVLYLNGGQPPQRSRDRASKRRTRACPVLAFLGLLLHFLSAGCGVALSVLIVRFRLQVTTAGRLDLVARILFFVASCMGVFYVPMHACAAREKFVRTHGGAQFFRFFTVAVAFIVVRLAAPVWIAAITITALVAADKGFLLQEGVQGNIIWIQLGIAALGLLSIFVMLIITERTERPFATSLFSKKSFIKGREEPVPNRTDTFDMSVSRQGLRSDEKTGATVTREAIVAKEDTQSVYDRSLIVTPTSPGANASPVPTVPVLPEMSEWRQKRDAALRTTMRVDDVRSQAVPSPLTTVYGPATPPSQDSTKQYGSHFSWRPPTRDSTSSPRTSHDMEEYRNNWPPPAMLQEPKSPNRASAPPPSQPPSVPLPPLVPPLEGASRAGVDNMPAEAAPESQRSTEVVGVLLEPNPKSMPDPQSVPSTNEAALQSLVQEAPVEEEAPRPRGRRPALPSLEKLSVRAAARHNKTPLFGGEAERKPRPSIDTSTDDATKTDSASSSPDGTEASGSDITRPHNYRLDTDDSGFEPEDDSSSDDDDTDDSSPEEPRRSRRSLLRSNTTGPRPVRNFSRPRVPSGLFRHRRPSEGNLPAMMGSQQWRRSRSLPPVRSRRINQAATAGRERNNVIEVGSRIKPKVPILQAAPVPARKMRSGQDVPQQQQQKLRPRLTPFPSAATSMAPEKKAKGLGQQGSSQRLDASATQWREGVDPAQARMDAQAELNAERRMMKELETRTSAVDDAQEAGVVGGGGGRRSTEGSRGRGRHAKKLSRDKSLNARVMHVAQNF